MHDGEIELARFCRHCGAADAHKLGQCAVCGLAVCERCGNVQHGRGERKVIHDDCLAEDGAGFTMIRLVK